MTLLLFIDTMFHRLSVVDFGATRSPYKFEAHGCYQLESVHSVYVFWKSVFSQSSALSRIGSCTSSSSSLSLVVSQGWPPPEHLPSPLPLPLPLPLRHLLVIL